MKRLMFLALSTLIVAAPAAAKKAAPAKAKAPAELKWGAAPPMLPAGAQIAVVSGDPMKAGKFTIRLKFPMNYSVPPHWHPTDEHVTLVEGKIAYGMSDRIDKASAQQLAVGDSITMKAKMRHWVVTGDGATVEVSSTGPFKITYVNAGDDPRGKQTSAR